MQCIEHVDHTANLKVVSIGVWTCGRRTSALAARVWQGNKEATLRVPLQKDYYSRKHNKGATRFISSGIDPSNGIYMDIVLIPNHLTRDR